jgi:class 3 adenylate cyclase
MPDLTIAFVDLTGSVSVFETLGNDRATKAITKLTQWIGFKGQEHGGTVVKMLGDGVLMSFTDNRKALDAVVQIQQEHAQRARQWPSNLKLQVQVGVARGAVVVVDGDCFGDAVNMASRLSDLAGPEQILASDTAVHALGAGRGSIRSRSLGPMRIKGKAEPCEVFRIEWQSEMPSEFLTMPAELHSLPPRDDARNSGIELVCLDTTRVFGIKDLPIEIGRAAEASFVISDPRVSRLHARIEFRSGSYVLEDTSSYGTWVRFNGGEHVIVLRRQECLLHSDGEIAMGAPFSDFSAPTLSFRLVDGAMVLGGSPSRLAS